jgi:uncharacterized membrane protein YqaE (UPF0057 family)
MDNEIEIQTDRLEYDYFILKNGKLMNQDQAREILLANGWQYGHLKLENMEKMEKRIEIIPRMRGGGILDMFSAILQIGKVFLFLLDLILWLVKFIAWFIMCVIAVIKFILIDMTVDFYNSITLIIVSICKFPFDVIGGLGAWVLNGIGGWMTTIWGWDQSNLTKLDKNSKYFKGIDRNKGRKCYLTNDNKVPFSILLGTILCPPMGVFMDMGLTGWFNILVCILLTLMFYVPGLVYALLVIYS